MLNTLQTKKHNLPTSFTSYKHPIHRWFNFIAGYSPEFVSDCIQSAGLKKGDKVIDPFAGLSTTLVQSMLDGIDSVGFDPHPFFYDISLAKITPPQKVLLIEKIKTDLLLVAPIKTELNEIWSEPALIYLSKLIPEGELKLLANAMLNISNYEAREKSIYRLIVSRVLELTSGSKTDGIYKAPTSLKKSVSYIAAVNKVCSMIEEDIILLSNAYLGKTQLVNSSSENMTELDNDSCNLCVTSPPYLNNFDYAEMTRMEFYFWRYASNWSEITNSVRRNLVVNTTTVPTDRKDRGNYSHNLSNSVVVILDDLVSQLKQMKNIKPGKKDYCSLVYPYFTQMHSIIKELHRVLKPDSYGHWVVGDSALYGIHIETHDILALIMQDVGFEVVKIENLRKRGDRWILSKRQGAAKGLGEFDIVIRKS